MQIIELTDLEKKYPNGVRLLKSQNFYNRLLAEANLLVKYFDNNYFFKLLTENLFDDIRGVFRAFVNRDLKLVYEELNQNPTQPLEELLNREYTSISILKSCMMNVKYQVSGMMRLEETRSLHFKSTFLQFIGKKLNGEIQELYRELANNYKQYFRKQFTFSNNSGSHVSLKCIEKLNKDYQSHFIETIFKFYHLSEAIHFVHDVLILELQMGIHQRISSIFYDNQEKMAKLLNYFIDDLKKNFIKTMDRNIRAGKDYAWIQNAFLLFLEGERFENLLRKVIRQSLTVIYTHHIRPNKMPQV